MKERKNLYLSMVGWGMFLAGALALSSCVDDELDNGLQTTGKNIGFNASYSRATWEPDKTRSAKEKTASIRCESSDGDFSVDVTVEDGIRSFQSEKIQSRGTQISTVNDQWGYKVGAYFHLPNNGGIKDYFDENTDATQGGYNVTKSTALETTNYYWPPAGNLQFFAVAPIVEGLNVPTAADITNPTITYTIPENVADQKDIMVANTTVACPSNTAVDLQFEHLLAAVQFKVGTMQFIKINSLTLSGIKGGTVTMTYTDGAWSYNCTSNNESYSPTFDDTSGLSKDDEITSNDNNSILLVAPQTLDGAKLTVSWTETITELNHSKTIDLAGTWVAGKTTVYALNIAGTDFGTVEIPRPDDQDAHYIMLKMSYNMGTILNNKNIKSVKATAQWLKDENGNDISGINSSKSGISLKFASELSETQKQGFWTDKRYVETITVENNNSTSSGLLFDTTLDSHGNSGLRGGSFLNITDANGDIVLFIEENNGTKDRVGELIFTAKLDSDVDIVLGKGQFKQLCPSWNSIGVGIERIETDNQTYAYGFDYTRKVVYSNPANSIAWIPIIGWIAQVLYSWGAWGIITDDDGDFITLDQSGWVIESVTLDYGALSEVQDVAYSENGMINTRELYNFTGGVDIGQVEIDFDENLGWRKSTPIAGAGTPEDYAAFIALSRNRMYEKKTVVNSSEGNTTTYKAVLYKNGNTDLEGEDIIEWYLPSSVEAKSLVETGKGSDGVISTAIDNLNGIYWSSTAGSDMTPAKSYTFNYTNNIYQSVDETNRTSKYKVRAARMKP